MSAAFTPDKRIYLALNRKVRAALLLKYGDAGNRSKLAIEQSRKNCIDLLCRGNVFIVSHWVRLGQHQLRPLSNIHFAFNAQLNSFA